MNMIATTLDNEVWITIVFIALVIGIMIGVLIAKFDKRFVLILAALLAAGFSQAAPQPITASTLDTTMTLNVTGRQDVWECIWDAPPPGGSCRVIHPPGGLGLCDTWTAVFNRHTSVDRCPPTNIYFKYYISDCTGGVQQPPDIWYIVNPQGNCTRGWKDTSVAYIQYNPCLIGGAQQCCLFAQSVQILDGLCLGWPNYAFHVGDIVHPPDFGAGTWCDPTRRGFQLRVTSVDFQGAVTGVEIIQGGGFSQIPENPIFFRHPTLNTAFCGNITYSTSP